MSSNDLGSLIERIEVASTGSGELDRQIHEACVGAVEWEDITTQRGNWPPTYTQSLDQSLALAERCLPGWWITLASHGGQPKEKQFWVATQVTPSLALCLALLRSMKAKEGGR